MVMETKKTRYDELQKKLDIFRQCRETLSKEDLQGRYRKAYTQLKSEISDLLKEMVETELRKIRLNKSYYMAHQEELNNCYLPFNERILKSVRTQYSVDAIMDIWKEFQLKMLNEYGASIDVTDIIQGN